MSKKEFKSGLDALLQNTLKKREQTTEKKQKDAIAKPNNKTNKEREDLKNQVVLLEKELFFWRTGHLTLDKFIKSLAEKGLKFDEESNSILPVDD